jgi:hypothetical protein
MSLPIYRPNRWDKLFLPTHRRRGASHAFLAGYMEGILDPPFECPFRAGSWQARDFSRGYDAGEIDWVHSASDVRRWVLKGLAPGWRPRPWRFTSRSVP